MAIGTLFRSSSKQLLQKIQSRDWSSPEEKKELYQQLATSKDVRVGDTFAQVYKVVSLSETKGVFMFGDAASELSVGQQILK